MDGPHDSRLTSHEILNQYWGFKSFRPLQEEIISSVLEGKDSLALMPTGGGKSLCYQIPGLTKQGLCLVISPLIALMKDQIQQLRRKNITAFAIYSGMSRKEVINTLKVAGDSNCKFLYVSPERLETNLFKEYLPGLNINLVAVDEAHCISQWGYDFRPSYLRIAALRQELAGIPILALTASATLEVQDDICEKLEFKEKNIFRQSFERPNLSYSVFSVDSKINKIIEILKNVPGSSIVYCKTRKRTKEISELLQMQNITSNYYHAGLTSEDRIIRQDEWINNKSRVIICTNAFGMGIDKPDVRTVIHADMPDCLENYYQEAGRAGRDGSRSYAVLLQDESDLHELEQLPTERFPLLEEIRNVYQSIANYLQIPTGEGAGNYYDFDISDFLRKFKLNSNTVVYGLKALEQEGWLAFNEVVFRQSTVRFTTDKDYLYEFERSNPTLEEVIKSLLRVYEGIFDYPATISETVLSGLLRIPAEEIKKQLLQLDQAGIIDYEQQKEGPQLLILRARIKKEDLQINMRSYELRKEKFSRRCRKMIAYAREKRICRSQFIGKYFGDIALKPCGVCDNCLRMKAVSLSKEEFESLNHRILNTVKYEPLHTRDLLVKLSGIKKEKAWKVLEFLQSENKIDVDDKGWVKLK
jgi:ATP-dependent DNA helicase RecQ